MTRKNLRKKVHNCFQDLWNIMFERNQDFCLKCGSKEVLRYIERICIYDKGKVVGFKDWGLNPFNAVECEVCGWNNF